MQDRSGIAAHLALFFYFYFFLYISFFLPFFFLLGNVDLDGHP